MGFGETCTGLKADREEQVKEELLPQKGKVRTCVRGLAWQACTTPSLPVRKEERQDANAGTF